MAWQPIADLPGAGDYFHIGAHGGKLYLVCGFTVADGNTNPLVWEYDPTTDAYAVKTACPSPHAYGAAGVAGTKIHVVGGYDTGDTMRHSVYDMAADAWTTAADIPIGCYGGTGVGIGSKLYVIGGWDPIESYHNHAQVWDEATDTWALLADLPGPRSYAGAGASAGVIHHLGGFANGPDLDEVLRYSIAGDSWANGPHALFHNLEAGGPGAVVAGRYIYLIGGYGDGYLDVVQGIDMDTGGAFTDTSYPGVTWGSGVGVLGDTVYVFGGWNGTAESAAAHRLVAAPVPVDTPSPPAMSTGNDNIADAWLLTGPQGAVLGTTAGATAEPGEWGPNTEPDVNRGQTVWFKFAGKDRGILTLYITPSGLLTLYYAVYRQANLPAPAVVDQLQEMIASTAFSATDSQVIYNPELGPLWIQIGTGGDAGFELGWDLYPISDDMSWIAS